MIYSRRLYKERVPEVRGDVLKWAWLVSPTGDDILADLYELHRYLVEKALLGVTVELLVEGPSFQDSQFIYLHNIVLRVLSVTHLSEIDLVVYIRVKLALISIGVPCADG